ncbi:Maf family protein [Trueperella sp. LYQ143]|uniref:Maf family protein n=1 Tax=unclassified Trueperella TaxID=2630174 RepID=UPI003983586A
MVTSEQLAEATHEASNTPPYRLLLASASPARRATLRAAGMTPLVHVSNVDEETIINSLPTPHHAAEVVCTLASAKAREVYQTLTATPELAEELPGARVVLGCDSMFDMDGQIVGKPATALIARERLRAMSGRSGVLYTGHCLIDIPSGTTVQGVSQCTVHIGTLSDVEIEAYIASGEPLRVAGSFTIDGLGGPFIDRLEGDHHGVVGISLPLLRSLLTELGYSILDFWDNRAYYLP